MPSLLADNLLPALTWTFVHSLWQGLVLTVLAGLALLLTRRSTAALRYALLCSLFFLFLCGVSVTLLLECNKGMGSAGQGYIAANPSGALFHPLPFGQWIEQATFFLNANAPWIVLAWLIVFLCKSGRMIREMGHIRFLRRSRTRVPEEHWTTRVQTLAGELGIRKTVSLLESALVKVPVVIGHFKPLILVPVGILNRLPPGEVESVLLHELAHIRRHDYTINFIQRVSELFFFFNPGLLWVSSLLRAERENCCDEVAISRTRNKLQFVEALISCKEHSLSAPGYSLGLFGKKNLLVQRLNRIVNNSNKTLSPFEAAFFVVSLLVLSVLLSGWGKVAGPARPVTAVHATANQPSAKSAAAPAPEGKRQTKKKVSQATVKSGRTASTNGRAAKPPIHKALEAVYSEKSSEKRPNDLESDSGPHIHSSLNQELSYTGDGRPEEVEAMRLYLGSDRMQAQKDRAQAEKDREQAARDRAQAEKNRQQADRDREQARRDREQAERERRSMSIQ